MEEAVAVPEVVVDLGVDVAEVAEEDSKVIGRGERLMTRHRICSTIFCNFMQ